MPESNVVNAIYRAAIDQRTLEEAGIEDTPENAALLKSIQAEVDAIEAAGQTPEVPFEFPEGLFWDEPIDGYGPDDTPEPDAPAPAPEAPPEPRVVGNVKEVTRTPTGYLVVERPLLEGEAVPGGEPL